MLLFDVPGAWRRRRRPRAGWNREAKAKSSWTRTEGRGHRRRRVQRRGPVQAPTAAGHSTPPIAGWRRPAERRWAPGSSRRWRRSRRAGAHAAIVLQNRPGAHPTPAPVPAGSAQPRCHRPVSDGENNEPGPGGGRQGRREPRDPTLTLGVGTAAARPSTSTGSGCRRDGQGTSSSRSPIGRGHVPPGRRCRGDRRVRQARPRAGRPRRGRGGHGDRRRPSASRSCSPGPPCRSLAEADCRDGPVGPDSSSGSSPCRCSLGLYGWTRRRRRPPAARYSSLSLIRAAGPPRGDGAVTCRSPSSRRRSRRWRGGRAAGRGAQRLEQPDHDGPRHRRLGEHVLDGHRADPARGGDGRGGDFVRAQRRGRIGLVAFSGFAAVLEAPTRTASGWRTRSAASRRAAGRRSAAASRRPSTRSRRWIRGSRRS